MADFDLSLVVRGKDEGASATGKKVEDSLNRLVSAEERAIASGAKLAAVTQATKGASDAASAAAVRLAQQEANLARAHANAAAKAALMGSVLRSSRVNLANFGQQVQDVSQQLALGINPMVVMMQQSGQLAFSLTGLGGKAGAVARFFAGPWGSILIAAAGILGMLALRSNEAAKSQEDLGDMADYVGRAQSQLAKVIDLVTGKFTSQNQVLREAIRLQAILAQQQAYKSAQEAGRGLGSFAEQIPGGARNALSPSFWGRWLRGERLGSPQEFKDAIGQFRANANASFTEFRRSIEAMAAAGKLKGIDVNEVLVDALKIAVARGEYQANKDIQKILEGGEIPDYLRKTDKTPRAKKERQPKVKDTFGVEEFGRDAANRIRDLTAAFADTPPQVERVNKAVAQLDDLIDDIQHKKPPNMKELLADAERAREAIQDGLNKPYNDFILAQQRSLDIARLIAQGHFDEAEALQIIQRIEEQMGPITQQRKDAVLATVQALKYEQRQAEILQQKQQKYLDLLNEVKGAIRGVFDDPIKGLKDLPGKLIGAVAALKKEKLFESLFGETFRNLQDRITGTKVAEDAAAKMAVAVDAASAANQRATAAVDTLAKSATNAANALQGTAQAAPQAGEVPGAPGGGQVPGSIQDIIVTGQRPTDLPTILQKLSKGVGISDAAAKTIGSVAGKAFSGAATGEITNQFLKPLGKALGFQTSQLGAQIGGAIGSFLPIPGGDIIGSIAGSIIGGLFKGNKPPPSGGATITNAYTAPTGFGDKGIRNASTALAESVQGGLLQIAESLGGTLGDFAVTVGQFDQDWRVNILGGTDLNRRRPGVFDFNEDQAAAIRFAIADAVKDGAILGLSDAVTKALGAYEDIDRSLREALKVQQLEDLIAGVGGSLTRIFKQFDTDAAERVRLAKTYGLDLLAVEKINAEDRAKLVDDLLKQRLGALQDLQKSILYGDLYEGDAGTRRGAILADIAKLTTDAEAGVEGAADQLADLYRQLIGTSREAYGTAGPEYAADRDLVTSGLDHIIQVERDRIEAAAAYQEATLDAANTNNALTNETNDLISQTNAGIQTLIGLVGGGGGFGGRVRLSTGRVASL